MLQVPANNKETVPFTHQLCRPHKVDAALTRVQNFFSLSNLDLLFFSGSIWGALDLTLCTCNFLGCDAAIMLSS